MLDLNEVAMFVQVARLGSFAEAARHLRMPSATVSRRIQQLETRLGTRLMQRSTRKLTLTSAGQAFHERCGPAVEELIEAGQSHVAGSQEPSGAIRVAASASFFEYFDMAWVSAFLAAHPLVQLDFVLSDLPADLIADRIDVAFRIGPLEDSSYVARRIFASYGGLLASPAYLAAHGAPADLGELAEHECVTQPPETGNFAIWRLQGPDGAEEEVRVRGRFTSNVQVALREAACAGLGIVALPTILTASEVAAGRLVPVLPGYMRAGRGLSVVYPSRQQRPLAVSAFVDMAVEKLSLREWTPSSGASMP
ncbi:LysR family transcriptional regulator [Variovorax sp. NFACC27]|uniref:LysR family transcriptional regulator n=1 Tax=unclassified Variovorax TaxID=663243 RepID=UPI00089B859E|nr:DNA-binding transcriptional regulator, LysR family [Variovorax sp. NFACC28]SEG76455.1 DNA-binding transcriptional regulator, LysR family [Variovorax sp. NFACC29]SFD00215.1 DNA-binding transcriptional regulator, LysR family [Variovorax sp. NFACC26]SFG12127.1 DNA-binding transcriptional regulator, LysR family [Variovorax sp. NFACC27]